MLQTATDMLRECASAGRSILPSALAIFVDTFINMLTIRWRESFMLRKLVRLALAVLVLLLVPFIAMRYDTGVDWTTGDFVAMGILLFGAGFLFLLAAERMRTRRQRIATAVACFAGLFLVWLNLAVGLIGSEDNPANQLYGIVLLIALVGSIAVRFRPRLLVRVMIATAIAQFLVPIVAFIIWHGGVTDGEGLGILGVFVLNGFFVALWLLAAWLFAADAVERTTAHA
jgi:hypothetical protein